jgi:hypothetical protein
MNKAHIFIVLVFALIALIALTSINIEAPISLLPILNSNTNSPFLLSAIVSTLLVLFLAYFGWKSKKQLLRYVSIFLLIFTFASWLSFVALFLATIAIIIYNILAIISKPSKSDKALLYSTLFGGLMDISIALPFLSWVVALLSLPPCPIVGQGTCNPGLNLFYIILIIISGFFLIFGILLIKPAASETVDAIKSWYSTKKKKSKVMNTVKPVDHNKKEKSGESAFTYIPIEIKLGLLLAIFLAIIGVILNLSIILYIIGITSLFLIFPNFIASSMIIKFANFLFVPLVLILAVSIYLLLRISAMWNAANAGNKNKLKELNSTAWAIIAIITVFLAPAGIVLLILHSPIDNLKKGLSMRDLERLAKLKKLFNEKVISKEEYEIERKRIIGPE